MVQKSFSFTHSHTHTLIHTCEPHKLAVFSRARLGLNQGDKLLCHSCSPIYLSLKRMSLFGSWSYHSLRIKLPFQSTFSFRYIEREREPKLYIWREREKKGVQNGTISKAGQEDKRE